MRTLRETLHSRQRSWVRWPDEKLITRYWAVQTHYSSRGLLWPLTVNSVIASQRKRRNK